MWTNPGNILIDHRHKNVEIGTEATQFPEKKYINGFFVAVCSRTLAGPPGLPPHTDWPPSAATEDAGMGPAVTTFTSWALATRRFPYILIPHFIQAGSSMAAEGGPLLSIFLSKVAGL